MKILLLNHEFRDFGGGAGRASYQIAKRLAAAGQDVDVITANNNGTLASYEETDGIRIHRVPGWRKSSQENRILPTFLSFTVLGTLKAVRLVLKNRYDCMHAFFTVPAGIVGVVVRTCFRIPLIISLRGSDVPYYRKKPLWVFDYLVRCLWKRADRVSALSAGLKEIAYKTLPMKEISVIHNGVDTEYFSCPMKGSKKNHTLRLISVTRLEAHKGLDYLFAAFKTLIEEGKGDFELQIVGEGSYRPNSEEIAEQLGLSGRISFCGYLSQADLVSKYCESDVFVLPSLTEAFGQVFTEAMSCGLPVIAANVGGLPEIVEDNVHGWLVPPGDSSALRDVLAKVLELSLDQLAEIGRANREYVKNKFSWPKITDSYQGLYDDVCRLGAEEE